jgi:hypothetical protein
MKAVCITVDGLDYLIRFDYIAETWDEAARVDIEEVMSHGVTRQMSQEFIEKAEAEILARYGKALQDQAAEEYATRQAEGAYQ